MVIKNLENKIKLVMIICALFFTEYHDENINLFALGVLFL